MAKHTLRDILSIFAKHAEHTHEAAVQATYDAGHAQGLIDGKVAATAEFEAGLKQTKTPAPPTGESDGEQQKDVEQEHAEAEKGEGQASAEGQPPG